MDQEKKRTLLTTWWADFIPTYSVRLFDRNAPFDPTAAISRLKGCIPAPSIYILFADSDGEDTPVYIGKADNPLTRWRQHLDGWAKGMGSYARWRTELLDCNSGVRSDLMLLVVPVDVVTQPPIPGFPLSMGSLEYQLVGLAEAAYPGRLFNSEGKGRC